MKKKVKCLVTTVIVILSVSILFGLCSCYVSWETAGFVDGLWTCYNTLTKKACVGNYDWDGDESKMEITVPDTYEKYKITSLGGATSTKGIFFGVEMPLEYKGKKVFASCEELPDTATSENIVTLNFTVHLGKYVDTLYSRFPKYMKFGEKDDNEKNYTYYMYKFYYVCSEENETFYSKDGVLYLKSNDEKATYEGGKEQ